MKHYCGVFGIIDDYQNSYESTISSLKKLQHRGYEGAGISYLDKISDKIYTIKNYGLVKDIFKLDSKIKTDICVGHVRYSTRKKREKKYVTTEIQPFELEIFDTTLCLVHNGNIPTINKIYSSMIHDTSSKNGASDNLELSDSYILLNIIKFMSKKYKNIEDILKWIVNVVPGTYSLVIMFNNNIFGIRDRFGNRPLMIGFNKKNYCVSSESIGFPEGYKFYKNVEPGEIVKIQKGILETIYQSRRGVQQFCSFEYIYFMNYESTVKKDKTVSEIRFDMGYEMAKTDKIIIDLLDDKNESSIVPIPNSSIPMAKGYSFGIYNRVNKGYLGGVKIYNLKYDEVILRKNEINRTFILSTQKERTEACDNKFIFMENKIFGKNIILIDDSIVRGTTMKSVVKRLYDLGAKSVHIRIISPPIVSACYFGIDMSTKDELIATDKSIEQICKELNASSLKYFDINLLEEIFGQKTCLSCFTGKYNNELLEW